MDLLTFVGLPAGIVCGIYFVYIVLYRFTKEFNGWTTSDEAIDNHDLTGKTVFITGANSGIGQETARVLLQNGTNVIMGCRSEKKAKTAQNEIISQVLLNLNNNKIDKTELLKRLHLVIIDLSSFNSILTISKQLSSLKDENKINFINYLVNNAGIMALPKYKETTDGYEIQFGTNHLGHFYLTSLIIQYNTLYNSEYKENKISKMRIINVSSTGHWGNGYLNFGNYIKKHLNLECGPRKEDYDPWKNYGISKTCNILFSRELNHKSLFNDIKVCSVSLHPGGILTNLQKDAQWITKFSKSFSFISGFLLKTMSQGASTTVRCVVMDDDKIIGGGYYSSCQPCYIRFGIISNDYKNEKNLWDLSVKLIEKKGFTVPKFYH